MNREERKERIQIKKNELKEAIAIKNLQNLQFIKFADEQIINKTKIILRAINCDDEKPEKIMLKVGDNETNIENLKNIIEKIQKSGNWIIPSVISDKWYEVEVDDIKLGIHELFRLYGADFFTIILKEEKVLVDVFWDEEYEGICNNMLGLYCIYIKNV